MNKKEIAGAFCADICIIEYYKDDDNYSLGFLKEALVKNICLANLNIQFI